MDSVSSSRDRAIQEGFIEIWQHSIDTKKMRKKGRRLGMILEKKIAEHDVGNGPAFRIG
jgi:hypothetical protein